MSMTDPIADMLTRIRNAGSVFHTSVDIPNSNVKKDIAKILKLEGYVRDVILVKKDKGKKDIRIYLKYSKSGAHVIENIERTSKPGRRIYVGVKEMPSVLSGLGIAIVTTSMGVMTNYKAKEKKIGGELLCVVW